jgi:hypothetical protein
LVQYCSCAKNFTTFVIIFLHTLSTECEYRLGILSITHFTSEFAPGGLIDEATAEERELAWMPATNDENEGALGSFRVLM